MDESTRVRIGEKAISVWLRADLEVLLERVSRRDNRPLLKRGDPREILSELIEERYPVYAEADIVVDSLNGPHEAVVEQIVRRLAAYLKANAAAAPRSEGNPCPGTTN